jgi:transcriptional regulator with XRE-family HTH domain
MIIKTRVFELANGKYHNLSDLARAMGLSVSQVYRVREGKRGINEKFLIGAKKAFPEYRLDELFYFSHSRTSYGKVEATAPREYNHATR